MRIYNLKNVLYFTTFNACGGVETYCYEMALKYKDYDITVMYRSGDPAMLKHISEVARVIRYRPGDKIICDTFIFGYGWEKDLFDNLDGISTSVHTAEPQYMEELGQSYGYILYRTVLRGPRDEQPLTIEEIRDRAQIFLNGVHRATYCRWAPPAEEEKLCFGVAKGEAVTLDILAENMGRVNYGAEIRDRKGARGIRLERQQHFGWDTYPLPMEQLDGLAFVPVTGQSVNRPTFFRGCFEIEGEPADTFIRLDGFHKGFVKVNGFNIGRYFNDAGPQKTLFVPAPKLRRGRNEILVFESDAATEFFVELVAEPDLG